MKPIPHRCFACRQLLVVNSKHLSYHMSHDTEHRTGWYLLCACGAGTPITKSQALAIQNIS